MSKIKADSRVPHAQGTRVTRILLNNLGAEAPTMLTTLLDGLLWRARKTIQGGSASVVLELWV